MARPVNANPEETRRKILSAAIACFAEEGYHGTSTRTLARSASVNIATLNYYYGSKQGLYEAAVDEVYHRLAARGVELAPALGELDLHGIMDRVYSTVRQERDGIRVLLRQVLELGALTERTQSEHYLPAIDNYTALFAAVLGAPVERVRVGIVAVSFLMSRYAVQDDEALGRAFGAKSTDDVHRLAVDSIVATARAHVAGLDIDAALLRVSAMLRGGLPSPS